MESAKDKAALLSGFSDYPPVLTSAEVAELLSMSIQEVRRLTRNGHLPDGSRVDVLVTLGWQNEEHVGTATGPSAASARLRLVGEATLKALEGVYPTLPPLAIDSIGESSVGMRTVVIAIVIASVEDHREELAVGAVLSQGDATETSARAVLDALNRRLPSLIE